MTLTNGNIVIPQILPEDAAIGINFLETRVTNKSLELRASTGGMTWEPGTTVEYTLSTSRVSSMYQSIYITYENKKINTFVIDDPYLTTLDIRVFCHYYITIDGVKNYKQVPWVSSFEDTNYKTITPDWIQYSKTNGNGSAGEADEDGELVTLTLSPFPRANDTPHTETLRNAKSETDCDLSIGSNGQRTTANCYVVNAPGTYKIPLYYGNSIQNNEEIYQTYQNAVNAYGLSISCGKISLDVNPPEDAILLWQDEPDLVQNVQLNGDYLTFSVPQATIHQGNAVVAVRDADGIILWSWHIWVTDYDPYGSDGYVTTKNSPQYKFMTRYLGWCDTPDIEFSTRKVYLRISGGSIGSGSWLEQSTAPTEPFGRFPLYQWGRKDPGDIVYNDFEHNNTACVIYGSDAPTGLTHISASSNIEYYSTIQNPTTFNHGSRAIIYIVKNQPAKYNIFKNFWPENYKTVYDPSPRGYRIPSSDGIDALMKNIKYNFINRKGYNVPTTAQDGSATNLFLPLVNAKNAYNAWHNLTDNLTFIHRAYLFSASTQEDQLNTAPLRIEKDKYYTGSGYPPYAMFAVLPMVDE